MRPPGKRGAAARSHNSGPSARQLRRRHPALRSVWWGAGFALVGTEVFEILVLMLTAVAYGAVLSVGALGFALRIMPLLLAPVITAALDRRPEQRAGFARLTVLARAAGIGLFGLALYTGAAPTWMLYVLVGTVAALDAAYLSATRATLPRLLRDETEPSALGRANSMLVVQWNTVQVLVPPVVIWILQLIGVEATTGIAVTALLVAFALLGHYVRAHRAGGGPAGATDKPQGPGPLAAFWQRLASGFRSIRGNAVARTVVVTSAAAQGAVFTFSVAVPQVVGTTDVTVPVGLVLSALAVGSIFGARWAARLEAHREQLTALLLTTAVLGTCLLGVALSQLLAVVAAAALVMGACAGVAAVARATLLQRAFREEQLGGVFVSAMVLGQVLMPFLPQVWETVADSAAIGWAFACLAALQLVALAVALWNLRGHSPVPRSDPEGAS